MQIKYFQTAWNDIKNSPGWFGKMCLLALVNLIPIFGSIVTFGYLYGWAREIAWGAHQPMPASIFANEDGKFWRRGWFLLVIAFVFSLIPAVVVSIGSSMQGAGMYGSLYGIQEGSTALGAGSAVSMGVGGLIYFVGLVLALIVGLLEWIANMRTTIYDSLSAGFQLGKIWKMFRHDTTGILKIFGMNLLGGLIIGVAYAIVVGIIVGLFVAAGIGGSAGIGSDSGTAALVLSLGGLATVIIIALTYLFLVASVIIEALVARAMGYWTMQFDVPNWRGQDDPMPFEIAAGAAAGAGPVAGAGYPSNAPSAQQDPNNQAPFAGSAPYGAGAAAPVNDLSSNVEPVGVSIAEPVVGATAAGPIADIAAVEPKADIAVTEPLPLGDAGNDTTTQPLVVEGLEAHGAHGVEDGDAGHSDVGENGEPHVGQADRGEE